MSDNNNCNDILIESSRSASDVLRELSRRLASSAFAPDYRFGGAIKDSSFEISCIKSYGPALQLCGTVESTPSGCRIQAHFGMPASIKVLMAVVCVSLTAATGWFGLQLGSIAPW